MTSYEEQSSEVLCGELAELSLVDGDVDTLLGVF